MDQVEESVVEGVDDSERKQSVLPDEVVGLALLGWLAWTLVGLFAPWTREDRIASMDDPALALARQLERPLEAAAVHAADGGLDEGIERLFGRIGDGPLGLDEQLLADTSHWLALGADDLLATAEFAREYDQHVLANLLTNDAAEIAARATIVGGAVGLDPHDFDGFKGANAEFVRYAAELGAELPDRANGEPFVAVGDPIELAFDGLPQLLVHEARGTLPAMEAWPATASARRSSYGRAAVLLLLPLALALLAGLAIAPGRWHAGTPPMFERVRTGDGLGAFALCQLGFVALSYLLVPYDAPFSTGYSLALVNLLTPAIALVAAGWRPGRRGTLGEALDGLGLPRRSRAILVGLATGVCFAPLLYVYSWGTSFVPGVEGDLWSNPYAAEEIAGGMASWWRSLVEAVVWAPVFEELVFRGVLFAALRGRMGFVPAALLSACPFALIHPYDLYGNLVIVGGGVAFAWLYERSGNLWACIAAHGVYNFALSIDSLLFQ